MRAGLLARSGVDYGTGESLIKYKENLNAKTSLTLYICHAPPSPFCLFVSVITPCPQVPRAKKKVPGSPTTGGASGQDPKWGTHHFAFQTKHQTQRQPPQQSCRVGARRTTHPKMSQQYVATAKKATAVSKSLVCHFTGPDDLNLLIAKGARLEIRDITPEGLQHRLDVPLYGAIATMDAYRQPEESTDRLFVLTERYQFCVLQYNAAHQVGELDAGVSGAPRCR